MSMTIGCLGDKGKGDLLHVLEIPLFPLSQYEARIRPIGNRLALSALYLPSDERTSASGFVAKYDVG